MKIATTDLSFDVQHHAWLRQETTQRLQVLRDPPPARADRADRPEEATFADISAAGRALLQAVQTNTAAVPPTPTFPPPNIANAPVDAASGVAAAGSAADNDPFLSLVKRMIETLTGREVKVFDMQAFSANVAHVESRASQSSERRPVGSDSFNYQQTHVSEEFEQTHLSASGTVRTADGVEIRFSLDLEMTRYFREESRIDVVVGDAATRKDPLVVNFAGHAAQLLDGADRRFRFDIDGDGQLDTLPLFAPGSGYLAFDRNGDGRIDHAGELFGPHTNDGFAELAAFDQDSNRWIDSGDRIFDALRVWTPSASGDGTLHTLAELGIGALGVQHLATPFALRGTANEDLGQIRESGLLLTRDGHAGSLQEIDLTL